GRLSKAAGKLTGLVVDKDRPAEERLTILKTLRVLSDPAPLPLLKELVADKNLQASALRLEAWRTLATLDANAGQDAAKPLRGDEKIQECVRGMALEFWVVGPFAGGPQAIHPPETKADPQAKYPGAKPGDELAWQIRQVEPDGFLNLRTAINREKSAAYAL